MKIGFKWMAFLSRHMMSCDEASFLISYQTDNRLGFKKWIRLKFHMLSCHLCRRYESQIVQLNRAVDHYRQECSSGVCQHHLPHASRTEILQVVLKEINAK